MKFSIEGICKECKNKKFKVIKLKEAKDKEELIYHETLCHDGYGYDLNTFDIICCKCGGIDSIIFESKKQMGEKNEQER